MFKLFVCLLLTLKCDYTASVKNRKICDYKNLIQTSKKFCDENPKLLYEMYKYALLKYRHVSYKKTWKGMDFFVSIFALSYTHFISLKNKSYHVDFNRFYKSSLEELRSLIRHGLIYKDYFELTDNEIMDINTYANSFANISHKNDNQTQINNVIALIKQFLKAYNVTNEELLELEPIALVK